MAQRKDLTDSIAATGDTIKKIDGTRKRALPRGVRGDQRALRRDVQQLFGGGPAGLALLDEDDILESGIDVMAQPPGKRLQNVHAALGRREGADRDRAAVRDLPVQAEAVLHPGRGGRSARRREHRPLRADARGLKEQTQFILITHSRKTMEIADQLYGVTMEEPGVSKLISLELN